MNYRNWNRNLARVAKKIAAAQIIFRQSYRHGLLSPGLMISLPMRVQNLIAFLILSLAWAAASTAQAQTNYYTASGSEYAIIGSLPGDQVFPDLAVTPNGGFVVWQDNITDGSGWGISAEAVNSTLSGSMDAFRVNVQGTNDQENPRVALLKNGGAAFVWQGGLQGYQHIFARFLNANNTFLTTTDVLVSAFTNNFQVNPAIATLTDSNVVIVWSSYDQAGSNSMQDVYAKILSSTGTTVSNEFLVNQFTSYNQRAPAVAALSGGGFVVTWISEQERQSTAGSGVQEMYINGSGSYDVQGNAAYVSTNATSLSQGTSADAPSVDVYARLYQNDGVPDGNEFLVDTNYNPCANPSVAAASDGTFLVAWSAYDMTSATNSWDVYGRPYSSTGVGGVTVRLNTYLYNAQYAPRLSSIGSDYMAVWTSLGEDGSREGVYGQFVHSDGSLVGGEFRVNTTTVSQQIQPVVASDGVDQFLAVWTSYTGGASSFDLFAQRYVNIATVLDPMPAPFVYAPFTLSNNVYQPQLVVSWAPLEGISVSNYEVYVNGAVTPMAVTASNVWTMTAANGLTSSSTNSFEVDYVTTSGNRSPLSPPGIGVTWGGLNWDGIPFEWMEANFGDNIASWPLPNEPIAPGGPTVYQVFLSGGTTNPATWLQQALTQTLQGLFLSWNTQPGATYQVQVTANLVSWSNLGAPRFAAGTTDSMYVGGSSAGGYYRVVLLRQ
jgi:hypothetical protein